MHRCSLRFLIAATLLGGCASVVDLPAEAGESSTGEGAGSTTGFVSTDGSDTATPTTTPPPGTTTGIAITSEFDTGEDDESTSATDGCGGFICPPDGGPGGDDCSIWDQDCPDGEKCTAWANDGGSAWNAHRCVPVEDDPDLPGEDCTVEGSAVSGLDSCAVGSMCFGVDSETNIGTCTPFCSGSPEQPTCEDPNDTCSLGGDSVLSLCLSNCDPLDPEACSGMQVCVPVGDSFACVPGGGEDEGGPLDPCEFVDSCDSGLMCVSATVVEGCTDEAIGCCTPYCALSDPQCPEPNGCIPLYEDGAAPFGLEDLGFCGAIE